MRKALWIAAGLALLAAIVAARSPAQAPAGRASANAPATVVAPPPAQVTCVFTNPSFSGKCVENANVSDGSSPMQACQAILSCRNNVDCLKTYCQATTIRTGRKLESAK